MKKNIMACFLSVLCLQSFALTGFDANYNAALKRAKDNSKPIFILFTGSDWCSWCVKFEKEVLSKSEFLDYATNTWELVVADFPQKKKIAPELKKQYQALQKKYAVRGFPTVMLIDAKGKELCSAGYSKGGAKVWLENFLKELNVAPLVEQYLAPIEKKVRVIGEESRDETTAKIKTLEPTDYKKWLQEYKSIANKYLPKVKAISDELAKLNVPDEISEKKEELSSEVNFIMMSFESAAKMDVEKEAKRIDTFGSQHDLAATLLAQLGIAHQSFVFSKNMLDERSPHFAFFTIPDAFGVVTENGHLVYDCQAGRVDSENNGNGYLEKGQAYLQKLYDDLADR